MKRLIIFLFFQALILTSFAQKFSFFSDNKELTIEEMKSFLSEVPKEKQKEADKLLDEFTKFWLESGATEENQDAFIEISNQMLKRKMRPFPQFNAFIHAHIQFCQSELSESNKEWIAIMKYHIANDAQRFHIKMKQYEDFFGSGTGNGSLSPAHDTVAAAIIIATPLLKSCKSFILLILFSLYSVMAKLLNNSANVPSDSRYF